GGTAAEVIVVGGGYAVAADTTATGVALAAATTTGEVVTPVALGTAAATGSAVAATTAVVTDLTFDVAGIVGVGSEVVEGKTVTMNISVIGETVEGVSFAGLRSLFHELERRAIAAGATELRINSPSVINSNVMGFLESTASRLGYTFSRVGENAVSLVRTLSQ